MKDVDHQVVYLMPLWGELYIKKFFQIAMPSYLASGNIPAMSQAYPATFLFLTRHSDIPSIQSQPGFSQLKAYCKVEFVEISDLLFQNEFGIHNITMVLAYERGMRTQKEKICQSFFFYLCADWLLANGSLANLIKYLEAGYSAILGQSFRVAEELFKPQIEKEIQQSPERILPLNSRDLLKIGFQCLHPLMAAEMVTQSQFHASYSNMLFWRVDEKTIVARYYTRHMICIKPEIDDYVIGGLCDYCFVHEMCPSGNVVHIQDSDDFCSFEMAPLEADRLYLRAGPLDPFKLAQELSILLTEEMRSHIHIPMIFHTEELKEWPHPMLQKSAEFVCAVGAGFPDNSQPYRGHGSWVGPIKRIYQYILNQEDKSRFYNPQQGTFAGLIGSPTFNLTSSKKCDDRPILQIHPFFEKEIKVEGQLKRICKKLFVGQFSKKNFWNRNWIEQRIIAHKILSQGAFVVIACEPIGELIDWLEKSYPHQATYLYYDFLKLRSVQEQGSFFENRESAVIFMSEKQLGKLEGAVKLAAKYLPHDSPIFAFVKHRKLISGRKIKKKWLQIKNDLFKSQIVCGEILSTYTPLKQLQSILWRMFSESFFKPKRLFTKFFCFVGLLLFLLSASVLNFFRILGIPIKVKSANSVIKFRME